MHYVSTYLDLALRLFRCVLLAFILITTCRLQCHPENDLSCRKLVSTYPKLHFFEICVLANLAPGDVEEAKILVPSLMVRRAFRLVHVLAAYDIMTVSSTTVLTCLHQAASACSGKDIRR